MRFFHLSDLHIGKQLHHYNLKEDQKVILEEIIEYAKEYHPDAILIAGDIYDKSVPSAEAVTLFDEFLTGLSEITPAIPVLMIAGNHDSAERLQYASEILKRQHIYVAGSAPMTKEEHMPKVTFTDAFGEVDVYLLPFLKPSYVRNVFEGEAPESYSDAVKWLIEREEIDYKGRRNVLVSHQFYAGSVPPETCDSETVSIGGIDNVHVQAVEQFDYVALGHLHGKQQVGKEYIRYCGTPLKYSVSEAGQVKCLTMVTLMEKAEPVTITELMLHPIRDVKKKAGTLEELLKGADPKEMGDYISITLTDEVDPYQPKERLEDVYSHILEIRIDNERTRNKLSEFDEETEIKSPFEAFNDFFEEMQGRSLTEEEKQFVVKIMEQAEEE